VIAHVETRRFSRLGLARFARPASWVLFGALPALVIVALFVETVQDDAVAFDFRVFFAAAEAILRGDSPYPALHDDGTVIARSFVYPPLTALAAIPLTILPFQAAGLLMQAVLVVAMLASLYVLGVSDWRCYGLVLLWPPVISAIQTGSVTILLVLAAALAWRYRDRASASALAVGAGLAVKTILWPLVVWQAAGRRYLAALLSCVFGAVLVLLPWAVIGFAGFAEYPDLLRRLESVVGDDSYTAYIVGLDLGLPSAVARGAWLALGLVLLTVVVALARRGEDRSAFMLAIAASVALTPIVWLHYFALLAVVVALANPRLGIAWFVPLGMVLTPGSGHPSPFETAWTLGVAAATVGIALIGTRESAEKRPMVLSTSDIATSRS
jgi:glycosyl transferase family 87